MTFFDPKEDIIDFELTIYGKELFSKGRLRPRFYSFSDEGIIYSASAESQNSTKERIISNTPFLKVIPNRFGNSTDGASQNTYGIKFETELSKLESIGNVATDGQETSGLKIDLFGTEIKTFSNFYTSSATAGLCNLSIPQVNIDLEFLTSIDDYNSRPQELDFVSEYDSISRQILFSDGGTVYVDQKQILLSIQEDYASSRYDNFELEVYEIMQDEADSMGNESLRKLEFMKNLQDLSEENGALLSPEQIDDKQQILYRFQDKETTDVDYYFDVFSDSYNEIPSELLEQLSKKPAFTIPTDEFNIYDSGIVDPEKC
jgi:hypothetical protein